ncbi:MAG: hypothetical protein HYW48_05185 [Deltaproteobacteria bacterium]|nr:hypothetical protein [Deltaproteobacteria bacterium]
MKVVAVTILLSLSTQTYAVTPTKPEIKDWFALGSGCRGREGGIGDIRMTMTPDGQNPDRLSVSFSMGSYKLSGKDPVNADTPTFARECSLRFALYPPPFKRVKNIEVSTAFQVDKEKGATAELHSRLMTATGTLKSWDQVLGKEQSTKGQTLSMNLAPDENGKRILSDLACGEAKVLGADFTFLNRRDSFKEQVEMKHDFSNKVEFTIQLESCGK